MPSYFAQNVSPVIVGREPELAALSQALDAASEGQGRCVFIAGEAGVGKSRLLDEIRRRALVLRFVVLQGNCFEQDAAYPYSLWISALRGYLAWRSPPEAAQRLGSLAVEFVKLLPELGLLLPDVKPTPSLDPESEKRRFFEAVSRFAMQLAAPSPLLIALEDLHWSDETSLELLHTLMQRVAGHPVMVIATYRSDEQPPQLVHFLAQANRERMAVELRLGPLGREQASEMMRAILNLDRPPAAEFVDLAMRLTEGNPFFIEEVIKAVKDAGRAPDAAGTWKGLPAGQLPVPSNLRDLVQPRIDRLGAGTRQVLSLAAVAGQRFSLQILQEISGRTEVELVQAVKELIAGNFVVEETADQFAFRHALTREAVYGGLLLRERKLLHKSIAEAMERQWDSVDDSRAAELAYHFSQAAAWEKAMDYSRRAGEQAQRLFAPREALAHFSRAAEAAQAIGMIPTSSLLIGRGHAFELLGEFDSARRDYERALESARLEEDRKGEWAGLIDLGFLWQSRDWVRAGEYFQAAYDLARSLDEAALVAHSLNRLGNWHMNSGRPGDARSCHQQALELFERVHDRQGMARTLELLSYTGYFSGDLIQGARYCEQAVPILTELDDREALVNALGTLSLRARFDAEVLGDVDLRQLAGHSEVAVEVARSCGYRRGEVDALTKAALCLCRAGDYGLGLEHLRRASSIAEEIEHRETSTTLHTVWGTDFYLGLLATAEAQVHLEAALAMARELGSHSLIVFTTEDLALGYILQHDLSRAREVLDTVTSGDPADATGVLALARSNMAARAALELALGRPARALEIVDRLLADAANLREYGPHAIPRLSRLRANALAGLGRTEEAAEVLDGALDVARRQGLRPILWRMHADLGKVSRSMSRRDEALQHFALARTIIEELAAGLPDGALRAGFLDRALALVPAMPALTPRRAEMKEWSGLTGREREVAALIAEGKSNREIADTLVLTVRTVEAHITRIHTKLDLKSRTEIAVWAVARGLARPPA